VSLLARSRPILALAALLAGLLGSPLAGQAPSVETQVYGLRPGDRLTISFYTAAGRELPEVAGRRTVDRNGEIFLPYVGTVAVEGLDATEVRARLVELYGGFYADPVVDVVAELRVNVTGAVNAPGNYYLDPSSTVLDALAAASGTGLDVGGFGVGGTVPSDISRVRLVRDGRTRILDLSPDDIAPEALSLRIQSGDWVFVPALRQSRLRQEVLFWGNVVGLLASVVSVIVVVSN
jgi:polysaccharide export outer membrane protein